MMAAFNDRLCPQSKVTDRCNDVLDYVDFSLRAPSHIFGRWFDSTLASPLDQLKHMKISFSEKKVTFDKLQDALDGGRAIAMFLMW
jgi:hypothetical protein